MIHAAHPAPAHVQTEQHTLGPLTVTFLQSDFPCVLQARPLSEGLILFQARSGEARLRAPQFDLIARPPNCILIQPLQIECLKPTSAVALGLPKEWLRRWLPRPPQAPCQFADQGWNGALCAVLGVLTPRSLRRLALPPSAVAENIGTLLALAAGPDSQGPPVSVFDSIVAALSNCLHLPDLSPAMMAERLRISLRTLHYAFATQQTSFMKELLRMRLERSAELLGNPHLQGLTVLQVAERCGFSDASYFTRRFRAHFGLTPSEFRSPCRAADFISSIGPTVAHPRIPSAETR
jgi:AraC-like DNA-binding protein